MNVNAAKVYLETRRQPAAVSSRQTNFLVT